MPHQRLSMKDHSGTELASAAKAGSVTAFELLVSRYQKPILRFLTVRCRSIELARDLTQITFVSAYEHLHQLKDPASLAPWLHQIARRSWQMQLRRQRLQRFISLDQIANQDILPDALTQYQPEIEHVDRRDLIQQTFDSLDPTHQEALWLRHISGFSDARIAKILDISPAAAQKRAYRAEIRFRKRYDELNFDPRDVSGEERYVSVDKPAIS